MDELLLKFPSNESLNKLINVNSSKKQVGSVLQDAYNYNNNTTRKKFKLSKDEYITGSIQKLTDCINCILNGENFSESFNEYYYLVENNCKNGNFSKLYNILTSMLSDFWCNKFLPKNQHDLTSMSNFVKVWSIWEQKLQKLKLIFLYLENNYLIHSKTKKTIFEYGCHLFSGSILQLEKGNSGTRLYEPNELKTRYLIFGDFVSVVRDHLRYNDKGEEIIRFIEIVAKLDKDQSVRFPSLINDLIVKIFEDLELNWISHESKINKLYVSNCNRQINDISEMLKIYFEDSQSYTDSITYKMYKILIFDRVDEIFNDLLPVLILHNNTDEVSMLYNGFIKQDQDLNKFGDVYSTILKEKIIEILQDDSKEDENLIVRLLNFKNDCYHNYGIMFQEDEFFEMKLRDAFKKSINQSKNLRLVIDKLNKFIVQSLKANDKSQLTRFQEIFKFIEDKELFKETYSLQLSKRLIFNKTELELEQYVISLLTSITGPDFTKSLEVMVSDIIDSHSLTRNYIDISNQLSFEFNTLTLNSIHWDKVHKRQDVNNVNFQIPKEMGNVLDNFANYWKSLPHNNNNSKVLKWCNHLNQLTLIRMFKNKEKQIFVNLLQGCILLLFNDATKLSFSQIKNSLQLEQDTTLISHLNSLSRGKYKLLVPSALDIDITTSFEINENFKSKSNIIKPSIMTSSSIQTTTASTTTNLSSSKLQSLEQEDKLRSLIIRILKFEKTLNHNSLINKIKTLINVDTQLLKRIIEKLIDEEYIKRSGSDSYEYIP